MRKLALLVTLLLPLICSAQPEYHGGELMWLPANGDDAGRLGLLVTKIDWTSDPLNPSYTAFVLMPGETPEVYRVTYHIDAETYVAAIVFEDDVGAGTAEFFGELGKWERVISRLAVVKGGQNMLYVTNSRFDSGCIFLEEKMFLEEETEECLLGTFRAVLYPID